VVAERVAGQ